LNPQKPSNTKKDPWQWHAAWEIIKACRLNSRRNVILLLIYYVLTPISAVADGVSWILLLRAISAGSALAELSDVGPLNSALSAFGGRLQAGSLMVVVLVLFAFRAASTLAVSALEGYLQAVARRDLQETCFSNVLRGRWEYVREGNVGQWVGAITEEVAFFGKYLISLVRVLYAVISFAILGAMAFLLAPKLSTVMIGIGVPAWLALRYLYMKQTRLSQLQTQARQEFAADITERLTGLFQIKAAGETAAHIKAGIRNQHEMTHMEILLGYLNGLLTAFNPIVMAAALLAIYVRARMLGQELGGQLSLLGGVGILGFRCVSQLNGLVAAMGNLTRLGGCIEPVRRLTVIPAEIERTPLPEPLREVRLTDVSYSVGAKSILERRTLAIASGRLFLIMGPSGAGKTTMANLVAGLFPPSAGDVQYVGESGKTYDAREYRARIGYVTQDVHLFRGSVRVNLDPLGKGVDADLWRSLERAGADRFVRALGGLDATIAEAGRSLSGGERRRLAIAQALAQHADCLILDEVTNGLDEGTKMELLKTIGELSRKVLMIAISHDPSVAGSVENTRLDLNPA
jgi:ATP-binding cassette subfamily C protein